MSTISSGLSLPGPADEESHKGSLARIQVGPGNLPESIAASKASRRHRRWSLEPAGGTEQRGPPSSSETNALTYLPMNQPPSLAATDRPPPNGGRQSDETRARHPAGARVRVRGQPRLLLQVQRRERGGEGRCSPPAAQRQGAVLLGLVRAGHDRRDGELGPARGRAGAGADVGDPGRAGGRNGVHRGDGRPAVRLRRRPPSVDRPVADRGRAGAARGDAAGDARRALAVLPGGDDLLRGRPVRARRAF